MQNVVETTTNASSSFYLKGQCCLFTCLFVCLAIKLFAHYYAFLLACLRIHRLRKGERELSLVQGTHSHSRYCLFTRRPEPYASPLSHLFSPFSQFSRIVSSTHPPLSHSPTRAPLSPLVWLPVCLFLFLDSCLLTSGKKKMFAHCARACVKVSVFNPSSSFLFSSSFMILSEEG
jgi:hypothetical protein